MLAGRELCLMKKEAVLVQASRGGIVDERPLADAKIDAAAAVPVIQLTMLRLQGVLPQTRFASRMRLKMASNSASLTRKA